MPWVGRSTRGGIAAVFVAVQVIGAEGQTPSPVDVSDGIAGAKRELEAARAAATPGAATTGRLGPILDLPTLNGPTTEMPFRPPSEAARRTEVRSRAAEWVVPEIPARNRTGGGTAGGAGEIRAADDQRHSILEATNQNGPRQGETETLAPPRDGTALRPVNPLAPFLSGWISAQDYQLLTKDREPEQSASPASVANGAGRAFSAGESNSSGIRSDSLRGFVPATRTGREATERSANPYLESFLSSPAPSSVAGLPPSAVQTAAPAGTLVSPSMVPKAANAPAAAPSRVPDFVRSTTDEKYFKPLKRF